MSTPSSSSATAHGRGPRASSAEAPKLTPSMEQYLVACETFGCKPVPSASIVFQYPGMMKHVHLDRRQFGKSDVLPFGEVLRSDKVLELVDFQGCKIGSCGCIVLRDVLEQNTTITSLNLSHNEIDERGARMLAEGLKKNKTLRKLKLHGNNLGLEGSVAIAAALKENDTLEFLDLSNNDIPHSGSVALREAMAHRTVKNSKQKSSSGTSHELKVKYDDNQPASNNHFHLKIDGNHFNEELFNVISHGIGAIGALIGGHYLVHNKNIDESNISSAMIYILSLFFLYTSSTLCHSFFRLERTGRVFTVIDKCCIYCLIAGTFTPVLNITLMHFPISQVVLAVVWTLALIGCGITIAGFDDKIGSVLYLGMGCVSFFIFHHVMDCMSSLGLWLLVSGGALYAVGVVFFNMGKTVPYYHSIWHVFVLVASLCHYFCVYIEAHPCIPADLSSANPAHSGL